jgi:5'-methylthioadenosine phosphorylase
MPELKDVEEVPVETPFGPPSDAFIVGTLEGERVAFLPRHGRGHKLLPTELPFRANIYAMKLLGVERILSASAVGSLQEQYAPLDMVIPDQFFDRTRARAHESTFFGDGIVGHITFAHPVCGDLGDVLEESCRAAEVRVHRGGTYLCIEGPQFSTKGESEIYRRWGVAVIGMTNMPEAKLAREAELCYATLALATDYDVWHLEHDAVTVEAVVQNLLKNVATAKVILRRVIAGVAKPCETGCADALGKAAITDPRAFPPATRKRLALFLDRYFPPKGRR